MSAIKITPELKAQAAEIAAQLKVEVLFVNDKGEFFTEQNRAFLSVGNVKENVAELHFATVEVAPSASLELAAAQKAAQKATAVLTKATAAYDTIVAKLEKAQPKDRAVMEQGIAEKLAAKQDAEKALEDCEAAVALLGGE
jgi:hypothetical protein